MLAPTQESAKDTTTPAAKRHGGLLALCVVLFALALAFTYTFTLDRLHAKAQFAESNFQSNLLRLGEFLYGKNGTENMLLGSSMTARLLPGYFQKLHVTNLSLDGSSGRTGLHLLIETKRPVKTLFIEENTIARPVNSNDTMIYEAMHTPQMQFARWFPFLRAAYRPSCVVYSAFKKRSDQRGGITAPPTDLKPSSPTGATHVAVQETVQNDLHEAVKMLRDLQAKGVRILIYRLPAGVQNTTGPSALCQALPDIPFVDISAEMAGMSYVPCYSDGQHLVGASARVAAHILENAMARPFPAKGNKEP